MDQGDAAALARRLGQEADPGGETLVREVGAAPGRMRPANGPGVVEEGRIGEHRVERPELQRREARGHIAGHDLHPIDHAVQFCSPPGEPCRLVVPLQAPEPGVRPARRRLQQDRSRSAADIQHALPGAGVAARRQQGRVHARPVSLGRLKQAHTAAHQTVFGDGRGDRGGGDGRRSLGCLTRHLALPHSPDQRRSSKRRWLAAERLGYKPARIGIGSVFVGRSNRHGRAAAGVG